MKHDILEDIIAHKQIELQHQKKDGTFTDLIASRRTSMERNTVSMRESLEIQPVVSLRNLRERVRLKDGCTPRQRFQISFQPIKPMEQQPAPS